MSRNRTKPRNQRDLEPALPNHMCKTPILDTRPFQLLPARAAAPFERTIPINHTSVRISVYAKGGRRGREEGRGGKGRGREEDVLKVAQFTDERPSCNDRKSNPEAPDDTAEDGEHLMPEQLHPSIHPSIHVCQYG